MPRCSRKRVNYNPFFLYVAIPFFVYLCFLVGKAVYKNNEINKELASIEDQILLLESENNKLREAIEYYKTDEYKIRVAREKLGLQKPGEAVIVITPDDSKNKVIVEEDILLPNYVLWWRFLTNNLD